MSFYGFCMMLYCCCMSLNCCVRCFVCVRCLYCCSMFFFEWLYMVSLWFDIVSMWLNLFLYDCRWCMYGGYVSVCVFVVYCLCMISHWFVYDLFGWCLCFMLCLYDVKLFCMIVYDFHLMFYNVSYYFDFVVAWVFVIQKPYNIIQIRIMHSETIYIINKKYAHTQ